MPSGQIRRISSIPSRNFRWKARATSFSGDLPFSIRTSLEIPAPSLAFLEGLSPRRGLAAADDLGAVPRLDPEPFFEPVPQPLVDGPAVLDQAALRERGD